MSRENRSAAVINIIAADFGCLLGKTLTLQTKLQFILTSANELQFQNNLPKTTSKWQPHTSHQQCPMLENHKAVNAGNLRQITENAGNTQQVRCIHEKRNRVNVSGQRHIRKI